ncbi:MAG TPA: iron-containing alcohol dehydrogenase, partial [Acidimicrobiales bacterium]|nr:iron-containing alcohol dehydrogenase [Acidimicrobiales bacterium]
DPHGGRSQLAEGPTVAPTALLLDDELLATLPSALVASTGVAALAHALEAAWSPSRSPEVEALALAALALLADALPRAAADPTDAEAAAALRDGAALAGRALAATTPGVQHALAGLLGARTRIPYGVGHAAIMGPVARFTADLLGPIGDRIAAALGADDVGAGVDRVLAALEVPARLGLLGVVDDDLDAVARQTGPHPWVRTHPRPAGEADVRALLTEAL